MICFCKVWLDIWRVVGREVDNVELGRTRLDAIPNDMIEVGL